MGGLWGGYGGIIKSLFLSTKRSQIEIFTEIWGGAWGEKWGRYPKVLPSLPKVTV
jgi:hypothetical protein